MKWTEDELAILTRVYAGATWDGIANALPGRTRDAVHRRACTAGIVRRIAAKPAWTGPKLKLLRELFPRASWPELLVALAPHTRFAIAKMGQSLGLRRPPRSFRRRPRRVIITAMRQRRIDLGWSQSRLAARIGVHQKQVQTWEVGASLPRLRKFLDWVEALDCKIELAAK